VKHKKFALGRLLLPLRLALCRIPFARKSNQKRTQPQRPPNLPASTDHGGRGNRCRAGRESCAGEFDELFLLKLAVVPDGTAALKVTVR
jgi:hypothetical protein